jgi:HAD superfamily hydrolase (TIGR01509 family)
MSQPLQLVVFDCDGVLVDSEPVASRVAARELCQLGWQVTPDECQKMFTGMTLRDALPMVEAQTGKVPEDWLKNLAARFLEAMTTEAVAVTGALEMLLATDALGLPWRVASNSSRTEMMAKFRVCGLHLLVGDRFHSAGDVARGKPAPDLFLATAAAAKIDPAHCLVIEDSLPGVRGALAAGMACLGFAPHGDGAALRDAGVPVVRALHQLPGIFAAARIGGLARLGEIAG